VDGAPRVPLGALSRAVAETVPSIVAHLLAAGRGRVHHEVIALLERPLLEHALALTGGNQLRAARLLGLNRNTLRKRCRELGLTPSRSRPRPVAVPPLGA
jgi:DNA-binding protein Fis